MDAVRLACVGVLIAFAVSACAAKQTKVTKVIKQQVVEQSKKRQVKVIKTELSDQLAMVPIYFEFDSARILPESQAHLQKVAKYMNANTKVAITIEGHCDDRGTSEYNLALSDRRARAATEYLEMLGVTSDRIQTISFGEERPAVSGSGEEVWAKNRRAEFVRGGV